MTMPAAPEEEPGGEALDAEAVAAVLQQVVKARQQLKAQRLLREANISPARPSERRAG